MKKSRILVIVFSLIICHGLIGQEFQKGNHGHEEQEHFDCGITQEMTKALWNDLRPVREKYTDHKVLKSAPLPEFIWPIRPRSNVYAPGFYVTSNQVDLDPTAGILDYTGGSRTYNNHGGIDIRIWPYYWTMMDADEVEIVAAAPGTIISKSDGNMDRNCSSPNIPSNRITILHDCGISTLYLHLKLGTITTKNVGDEVNRGEYLGLVGSSGRSSNPHLHFEVQDLFGNSLEPFEGPFNNTIQSSMWTNQKPYYESSIVKLMTQNAVTDLNNCDDLTNPTSTDSPRIQNHFSTGAFIRFGTYFMSPQTGQSADYFVYDTNSALVWDWTTNFSSNSARGFQNFQSYFLSTDAAEGTWTFRVVFDGNNQTAEHHFTVGCQANGTIAGFHSDGDGHIYSNRIHSTAEVGADDQRVHYEAGNYIELRPGFTAEAGCSFRTRLDACVNNGN